MTTENNTTSTDTRRYAYSYQRWSSLNQSLGSSGERQDNIAKSVCDKLGLTLVDTIRDEGVSAKDGDNLVANFASLGRTVKPGEYIIVENWDRISRAGKWKLMSALRPLVENDITIIIANELDDNDMPIHITISNFEKDYIWNMMSTGASMAKKTNDEMAKRKLAGWKIKLTALLNGEKVRIPQKPKWISHTPPGTPVGYIVDERKAALIKKIFSDYASGVTVMNIVEELQRSGERPICDNGKTKTHYGIDWSYQQIISLLQNKAVLGLCCLTNPPVKIYPQLISEEQFAEVGRIIRANHIQKKYTGRRSKRDINLFRGLCVCGLCGHTLSKFFSGADYKGVDGTVKRSETQVLRCHGRLKSKCSYKTLNYNHLKEVIGTILIRGDVVRDLIERQPSTTPSKIPVLEARLNKCIKHRQYLYDLAKKIDKPTSSHDEEILKTYKDEELIISNIADENERLVGSNSVVRAMTEYKDKFAETYNRPTDELKQMLRRIISKIEVDVIDKTVKVFLVGCEGCITAKINKTKYTIGKVEFKYKETVTCQSTLP